MVVQVGTRGKEAFASLHFSGGELLPYRKSPLTNQLCELHGSVLSEQDQRFNKTELKTNTAESRCSQLQTTSQSSREAEAPRYRQESCFMQALRALPVKF